MTDLDRTLDAIDKQVNTFHRDTLLAYADICLDKGKQQLSDAYRWMAENSKWPCEVIRQGKRRSWKWTTDSHYPQVYGDELPTELLDYDDSFCTDHYPSCTQAIHHAARLIAMWLKDQAEEKLRKAKAKRAKRKGGKSK